jgi:hypothetical protein
MVRLRRGIPAAALLLLALLAFACDPSGTGSGAKAPLSCPEIADSVFPGLTGLPRFRVVTPNGGEVFHVGERLRIILTVAEDSEAVAYISYRSGGTFHTFLLPESPRGNFNPRTHCDLSFTILDSVNGDQGKMVSLVSDSVKIKVVKYGAEATFYDFSDAYFRIVP